MPERIRTVLRFNKTFALSNAGTPYGNVRFVPTDAYDVDPVVGSTAMPGFTELAGIYTHYRVNKYRCKCAFSNDETFSETVYLALCNVDPGANTVNYQDFLSSRRCVKTLLGPATGNGIGTLQISGSQADFGGVLEHDGSLNGTVGITSGTAPLNNMYVLVGFYDPGGNSSNGINVSIDLDIELDFFELYSPHA
jgi:hypothetical protein